MQFPVRCPHCGHEQEAEYLDGGIHELRCGACGRSWALYVRKHRFELLFDLGTRALRGGYAREAVGNFAAALERCLEFYARAALLERLAGQGTDLSVAEQELEATWKLLVNQSERQTGAFAALYLLREGRAPDLLTPGALSSEFRNRVIHRGLLPRQDEVEAYAARLYALMSRLLTELGGAALQMELLQERVFAAHLDSLPDGTTAVFEDHPGMFRQALDGPLGGEAPPARPANLQTNFQGRRAAENTARNAAAFEQAWRAGGQAFRELFGQS